MIRAETFGAERKTRVLEGLRVSEVVMPGGLELEAHRHESAQVVFVLEGSYVEHWRGRRVTLRPGSVLYRPPGEPHANVFPSGDVSTLLVSYPRERVANLAACRKPTELPAVLDDLRALVQLELGRRDAAADLALQGLLLLLLARTERLAADDAPPAWLARAAAFVERHYAGPIGLATVAAHVGLHRATVATGFRRYLDTSVGDAIRQARVRHALERLVETRLPLAVVAAECGFVDQAHLGRVLKRATGRTPLQIRAGR